MQTLPLFYQEPIALNKVSHANWYVEEKEAFSFAKSAHAIRINVDEFALAAGHYPILFAHEKDNWFAIILTGLHAEQNLFVNQKGAWAEHTYVPAYVRRYPFIPAQTTEAETLLVCLDKAYPGVNQQGRGQPLFVNGEMTEYSKHVTQFLENFEAQAKLTSVFIAELNRLNLFKQIDANLTLPGKVGTELTIPGFFIVDREKLNTLSESEIVGLTRNAVIDQIVIHLQSLQAFHNLMTRATARRAAANH